MKVYQIEISNLCNLECVYCPHPQQHRPKGLMSEETFRKSLQLLKRCGQGRAFLHNFGEPLLHPELTRFIGIAGEQGISCSFFTNGVLIDREELEALYAAGLREICISSHVAGEGARIHALIEECGLAMSIIDEFKPSKSGNHTWAGQVDKGVSSRVANRAPCIFERENAFVILWDGRINTCCIAVEPQIDLNIDQVLSGPDYAFRAVNLCAGCSLMRGEEELV
jgi:hypothetical protein